MSLVAFTGFELNSTAEILAGTDGTCSISSAQVHSGSYSFRCNPTTTALGHGYIGAFDSNGLGGAIFSGNKYVTFWFYAATLPASSEPFFRTATNSFNLRIASDGKISAYSNTSNLLSTGATILSTGQWYKIEISLLTTGWALKVNGASEISGATNYSTNTNLSIGKSYNANSGTVDFYFDDYFVDNAAFTTADSIKVLTPISNGAQTSFTGDYTAIDELPHNSGTDYINSATAGHTESVRVQTTTTAGISAESIIAVCSNAVGARSGTSTASHGVISGATTNYTGIAAWSTSYALRGKVYTTDPNTSAAWTTGAIDVLEPIVKLDTYTGTYFRVTAMYAQVAYKVSSASGPANLKSIDGLAKASVKNINGLAIASVKSWNGII